MWKNSMSIEENTFKKNAINIIKGSVFSIIFSIVLLTIFAMLLTYTDLPESTIKPVVITIAGISILIGSTISTKKIKKNGMIYGGIVGIVYIIIVYLASSLCTIGFSLSINSFIVLAVGAITGIIGGIIGVNSCYNSHLRFTGEIR